MSNTSIEIRGCKSVEELNIVVELCDAAFPKTTKEYFERHLLKDKTLALNDTRILLKDGKIVSSVQVFPRIITIQKEKMKLGAIGNVATLPSERRNGYAGILMKDAFVYMINKEFPLSILTTHINSYYEKFDFKTVLRTTAHINLVKGKSYNEIRKFDMTKDLPKVINLYNEFNNEKTGTFVRDEMYWLSQLDFSGEDKDLFLIYETEDELKGYIRAQRKDDFIKILEYAFKAGNKTVVTRLMENISCVSGVSKFELFLTEKEEENIKSIYPFSLKEEKGMMVCFLDKNLSIEIKNELLKDRDLNFWPSDSF